MKKKRNYVSPLWLQSDLTDGGEGLIIIGDSQETGGIGSCFEENDMLTGEPGAKVYYIQDGKREFVGYHQVREDADDYDEYYDINGEWIDLSEYSFYFELYVEDKFGLVCK